MNTRSFTMFPFLNFFNSLWLRVATCSEYKMALKVKNMPAMQETWVPSLGKEDPWRREWLPTPVFLPGESP